MEESFTESVKTAYNVLTSSLGIVWKLTRKTFDFGRNVYLTMYDFSNDKISVANPTNALKSPKKKQKRSSRLFVFL